MLTAPNRVQSVTIVDRRSGPGYRIVLCLKSPVGTPVLETLTDAFPTIAEAERFAVEQIGVSPAEVRTKARASA